jgi:hypothetical protein
MLAWLVGSFADVRLAKAQEPAAGLAHEQAPQPPQPRGPTTPASAPQPGAPESPAPPVVSEHPVRFALTLTGESNPLEACGGAQAVRYMVERQLRRPVFTDVATADRYLVVGGVRPTFGVEWTANIVELDRHDQELGQRGVVVRSDDCAKAVATVAVVLAITIGPPRMAPGHAPGSELSPNSPTTPEAESKAQPALIKPPPPKTAPQRPPPLRWSVAPLVELEAGSGIQPGLAWGVGVGAEVAPPIRRTSLIVRGQYWPSKSTDRTPEGRFDRVSGVLLGCYELFRPGPLTVTTCAGVDVGRLHADVPRVTRTSDQTWLTNIVGEARVGYRLGRWGPFVVEPVIAANVAALLERDRFTYVNRLGERATLHQPAPVAVQGAIGLVVHFF